MAMVKTKEKEKEKMKGVFVCSLLRDSKRLVDTSGLEESSERQSFDLQSSRVECVDFDPDLRSFSERVVAVVAVVAVAVVLGVGASEDVHSSFVVVAAVVGEERAVVGLNVEKKAVDHGSGRLQEVLGDGRRKEGDERLVATGEKEEQRVEGVEERRKREGKKRLALEEEEEKEESLRS